jgi:hypothetical protein
MIYDGSFVSEGRVGIGTQDPFPESHDQWAQQDVADINGDRLFFTQQTQQATGVCVADDDEEALGHGDHTLWLDKTVLGDAKKKGIAPGLAASPMKRTNVCATRGSQSAITA